MNILGIALLFIIIIICYKIYYDYQNKQTNQPNEANEANEANQANNDNLITTEKLTTLTPSPKTTFVKKTVKENNKFKKVPKIKYSSKHMPKDVSKFIDKMFKENTQNKIKSIKQVQINPYFQEMQFHQDYRDTLNAFGLMCEQKPIFNKSYLPLLKSEKTNESEVSGLVDQFVSSLNTHITNDVGDIAAQQLNSWNDNMPPVTASNNIIKKKASWEDYNEELGLPPTIYIDPAAREQVKLLKIDNINKYETSAQLKYCVYLILQKPSVVDQMIVKVSFVIDKNDVDLEREFFDKNKNKFETKIIIEEIATVGFMIKQGSGKPKSQREKFYDYDGFDEGRLISEKDVIRQLNNKRKEIDDNFICHM